MKILKVQIATIFFFFEKNKNIRKIDDFSKKLQKPKNDYLFDLKSTKIYQNRQKITKNDCFSYIKLP